MENWADLLSVASHFWGTPTIWRNLHVRRCRHREDPFLFSKNVISSLQTIKFRNNPLISLSIHRHSLPIVRDVLWLFEHNILSLSVDRCEIQDYPAVRRVCQESFPILEEFKVSFINLGSATQPFSPRIIFRRAPSLRRVEVIAHGTSRHPQGLLSLPWAQLTELMLFKMTDIDATCLLAQCHSLSSCSLTISSNTYACPPRLSVLHHNLQRLHLQCSNTLNWGYFFPTLILPSLRDLSLDTIKNTLPTHSGFIPALSLFIRRSTCSLEKLHIGFDLDPREVNVDIRPLLRLLPSLKILTISITNGAFVFRSIVQEGLLQNLKVGRWRVDPQGLLSLFEWLRASTLTATPSRVAHMTTYVWCHGGEQQTDSSDWTKITSMEASKFNSPTVRIN